ncbi:OLC1v1036194C1 [Oldenlandia corymbosa var. corymbosa]|uniref:OLC1v1036194C1 n=1 Tax=Oldenlandia corymbosa var. corymbosa TaxID=529605 RepID=A0AAV1CV74_OLDCO|nr:OLC1v1036194C1 [Oldenlandia corymbosa var. corymbosa]
MEGKVGKQTQIWQTCRRQWTELETNRLEHGPKTRMIPGGSNNEDEEDVEDINVGEDDIMMDDVLDADDNSRRVDETTKTETGDGSPQPENEMKDQ